MSVNFVENETKIPSNIQVITHQSHTMLVCLAQNQFFRNIILLILETVKKKTIL